MQHKHKIEIEKLIQNSVFLTRKIKRKLKQKQKSISISNLLYLFYNFLSILRKSIPENMFCLNIFKRP